MEKVATALALGSGGARGIAHIGAIRCLEEHGYDIRYIAGSSMGAVVGGIYAAGKLDVFTDWVSALERLDVLRLLDWSFSGGALFKGERIIRVLRELIGDSLIEELPIGFTAIATELSASREIWLNSGSLFDAIRASIAVPTIFAPVQRGRYLLVDGGIVNPVPVAPTLNSPCDATIVVDLNAPDEPDAPVASRAVPAPAEPGSTEPSGTKPSGTEPGSTGPSGTGPGSTRSEPRQRILHFLDGLFPAASPPGPAALGFHALASRSMDAMQRTITRHRLAGYEPTVTVRIPGNLCGFFDFYRARELIDYGYERTRQTLARLPPSLLP